MFDLAALEAALAKTIFAGHLHFSAVTDSTNTDALEAARAGRTGRSTLPTSSELAVAAAIIAGTPPQARDFT
jgi:hypothetical protein